MFNDGSISDDRKQRPAAQHDPRLNWWREARFGMFIHWGLYAIPAGRWQGKEIPDIGEWIMHQAHIPVAEYEKLALQFNPQHFNPAEWVSLAKRAGQKYLVITSKHHDGFCLFKSEYTPYNAVDATPFGRDIIKELAEECARQGIKFGLYYSQTQDWHHPGGAMDRHQDETLEAWQQKEAQKDFAGYIENYVKPQVRELLTHYGPISLIWFDTPLYIKNEQSQSLLELVHSLQPDCLVCGRVGNALGDYASAYDNLIPGQKTEGDWETPATINDTWGFKTNDHNWKSAAELAQKLIDITSKGGNYLLNVGPRADGIIPEPSVARLEALGAWLAINGESIYGTQAGPLQGLDGLRTTARPGKIYLHVFDWPGDGVLQLAGLPGDGLTAYLLADAQRQPLPISQQGDRLLITVPPADVDRGNPEEAALPRVVVLEMK